MTITEFLLARIAEDKNAASHAAWAMQGEWFTTADDKVDAFVQRESPARVLAECAAKRAIVEEYSETRDGLKRQSMSDTQFGRTLDMERTLSHLAAVYADHPDYDAAWGL